MLGHLHQDAEVIKILRLRVLKILKLYQIIFHQSQLKVLIIELLVRLYWYSTEPLVHCCDKSQLV